MANLHEKLLPEGTLTYNIYEKNELIIDKE